MKQTYSKDEWKQMVLDYRNSGVGLVKWCQLHNVSSYAMKYHMYHKSSKKDCKDCIEQPAFVPLVITEHKPSVITINVDNASINVDQDTDLVLLKDVLEALQ